MSLMSSFINTGPGHRLKYYRCRCGMTQMQVSNLLNIELDTYKDYEDDIIEVPKSIIKSCIHIFKAPELRVLINKV